MKNKKIQSLLLIVGTMIMCVLVVLPQSSFSEPVVMMNKTLTCNSLDRKIEELAEIQTSAYLTCEQLQNVNQKTIRSRAQDYYNKTCAARQAAETLYNSYCGDGMGEFIICLACL